MGKNKKKWGILHNIYKPGTAKYYRDQLINIADVCVDYDGYRKVEGLKGLIDSIKHMAISAIAHKKLYRRPKE